MIAADTITKGQTFTTKTGTYTALENAKADKLNINGGYKVYVTDGTEQFYHLLGINDMVTAA